MLNKASVIGLLALIILQIGTAAAVIPGLKNEKDTIAILYSKTITSKDIKAHLSVLASDEYEGRETGEAGQKKAAKYISNYFSSIGIPPYRDSAENDFQNYYQIFPLIIQSPYGAKISSNGKDFQFIEDFYFFSGFEDITTQINEISFLGYGIESDEYNDYNGRDVVGKWIIILAGEPFDKNENSIVTGSKNSSNWSSDWRKKRKLAKEKGAIGMFIVSEDFEENLNTNRHNVERSSVKLATVEKEEKDRQIPNFYMSVEMANNIMAASKTKTTVESAKRRISKKRKPYFEEIKSEIEIVVEREKSEIQAENVLGYIEGTDKKDEVIIITAHYDHLGISGEEIYNGADDNGSGTVALLELAEAFAKAKSDGHGARRSILIMPVSGEEKGLLGSKYYTENPVYPLENTVANLNIDMIGRIDTIHEGNPNYIYLIGADRLSKELHEVSERANSNYVNIELDYRYNAEDDPNRFYYRSDHYNFAKNNIPVIFYFNGVHEDYHKPTDTVDKINFSKLEKITKLIYFTVWELANMEKRIVLTNDTTE